MTKTAAKRTRRLSRTGQKVKDAMTTMSEPQNSLTRAMTHGAVDRASLARREVRGTIRQFEMAGTKEARTRRLRTRRAWNKLGAAERRFIRDCAHEDQSK